MVRSGNEAAALYMALTRKAVKVLTADGSFVMVADGPKGRIRGRRLPETSGLAYLREEAFRYVMLEDEERS